MSKATTTTSSSPSAPPTSVKPLTTFSANTITTLALSRILIGAAGLLAPRPLFAMSGLPFTAGDSTPYVLARMWGARDLIMGGLLYTAGDKTLGDGGRREMRRALWAGLAADALDLLVVVVAAVGGDVGTYTLSMMSGGVVVAVGMGVLGLRAL